MKLHLLSAKALFKLRQFKKVVAICEAIQLNEKNDEILLHSADLLRHLALKMMANETQPQKLYLAEAPESYFEPTGFIHRLLSGSISKEDMQTTLSIEQQLCKEIANNTTLSLLQKASKVVVCGVVYGLDFLSQSV